MGEFAGGFLLLLGTAVFLLSLVALFRPMPRLRLSTRPAAAAGLALGVVSCVAGAGLLPAPPPEAPAAARPRSDPPQAAPAAAPAPKPRLPRVEVAGDELAAASYAGAPGVVHLAPMRNDDGSATLWTRTRLAPAPGADRVTEAGQALQALVGFCSGGAKACEGAKDLYLNVHGAPERHGSAGSDRAMGFLLAPGDWREVAPSPAAALERAEPLPATPNGRASLAAWCAAGDRRSAAPDFCRQVDALVAPRR